MLPGKKTLEEFPRWFDALCHKEDEQRTNNKGDTICSHESIHRRKQSGIL